MALETPRWQGGKPPTWVPSEIVTDRFPDPPWEHLVGKPGPLPRPLEVALPCVGLDGCSHALNMLGVPYHVVYAFDTAEHLRRPLEQLHGRRAFRKSFAIGAEAGVFLRQDVA